MITRRILLAAFFCCAHVTTALAEGTDQLNGFQQLQAKDTVVYADIRDPSKEVICWVAGRDNGAVDGEGRGSIITATVFDPSGAMIPNTLVSNANKMGTTALGECLTTDDMKKGMDMAFRPAGAYKITFDKNLRGDRDDRWDISVCDTSATSCALPPATADQTLGRIWSLNWKVYTGVFTSAEKTDASIYARVPGGSADTWGVVELSFNGLAGNGYELAANFGGVQDKSGQALGRSVRTSTPDVSIVPEYRIYLAPPDPEVSPLSTIDPELSNLSVPCNKFNPDLDEKAIFQFSSNVQGSVHLQCDVGSPFGTPDGQIDIASGDDLLIVQKILPGQNTLTWNGQVGTKKVPPGNYSCRLQLNVGEFHYVGRDIETAFQGLRTFEVKPDQSRVALPMYWNDTDVQGSDADESLGTNGGPVSPPFPPTGGLSPGNYADAAAAFHYSDWPAATMPVGNARGWGKFVEVANKGQETYLDTFTWIRSKYSDGVMLTILSSANGDGRGCEDVAPIVQDTDSDTVPDEIECPPGMDPPDTDSDTVRNCWDEDDDGDGIPTKEEAGPNPEMPRDTDGDGTPDYLDLDSDNDGILDSVEGTDDLDGDGKPNYLDTDSDGDGSPDKEEGVEDRDGDGVPDYLDIEGGLAGGACPSGSIASGTHGTPLAALLLLAMLAFTTRRRTRRTSARSNRSL